MSANRSIRCEKASKTFCPARPPRLSRGRGSTGSSAWTRPRRATRPPSATSARTVCASCRKSSERGPDLQYQTVKGALLLSPSPPRIAPSQLRLVG